MVTLDSVMEAQTLPTRTTAQKAQLIIFAWALLLAKGRKANVYTDSKYVFATVHFNGAIYRKSDCNFR